MNAGTMRPAYAKGRPQGEAGSRWEESVDPLRYVMRLGSIELTITQSADNAVVTRTTSEYHGILGAWMLTEAVYCVVAVSDAPCYCSEQWHERRQLAS